MNSAPPRGAGQEHAVRKCDVIVVGLGAMGSATVHAVAQRGKRVLGIDRFQPPHDRGSSYGETRAIRMAYDDDPAYVALLRLAFEHWRKLESSTGQEVLRMTGVLEAGYRDAPLVQGSVDSAVKHGLAHELLSPRQVAERFPAFTFPNEWDCAFHADAGVLFPEKAIRLFLSSAESSGATLRLKTTVTEVCPVGDHVEVHIESGEVIEAGSAVLCAGPWTPELVPGLRDSLSLTRQSLVWFRPRDPQRVRPDRMPIFALQLTDDLIYGFPDVLGTGVKVASHLSGGELRSAEAARAEVSDGEKMRLANALECYIPAASGQAYRAITCLYTRAPDNHFVLGLHPDHPQIVVASPCSGHGFKFASIFGEVLADLATTQSTDKPIDVFRPNRFIKGRAA